MKKYILLIISAGMLSSCSLEKSVTVIQPVAMSLIDRQDCLTFRLNHCKNQMRHTPILLRSTTQKSAIIKAIMKKEWISHRRLYDFFESKVLNALMIQQ